MRRTLLTLGAVAVLAGCNLWSPPPVPSGFEGWFHLDRPERPTTIAFTEPDLTVVHDLGCDRTLDGTTPWVEDSTGAVVLSQWGAGVRFTLAGDAGTGAALIASPGMYSAGPEQWMAGAACLVCPVGDAGVTVACDTPALRDGGI
jgi:hypothetical protein